MEWFFFSPLVSLPSLKLPKGLFWKRPFLSLCKIERGEKKNTPRNKKVQCPEEKIKTKCSKTDLSIYCSFSDIFRTVISRKVPLIITFKSLRTTCSVLFNVLATKHTLTWLPDQLRFPFTLEIRTHDGLAANFLLITFYKRCFLLLSYWKSPAYGHSSKNHQHKCSGTLPGAG